MSNACHFGARAQARVKTVYPMIQQAGGIFPRINYHSFRYRFHRSSVQCSGNWNETEVENV